MHDNAANSLSDCYWWNSESLFHCRCSRLQDILFVLTWICFSISPPSYHILDSNMKRFHQRNKVMGLNPQLQQAFLCTISVLSSYLCRFPPGALVFPHQRHTGQASPHWGHRRRTDLHLTYKFSCTTAVFLLLLLLFGLRAISQHLRLCTSMFTASPSSGKQNN